MKQNITILYHYDMITTKFIILKNVINMSSEKTDTSKYWTWIFVLGEKHI